MGLFNPPSTMLHLTVRPQAIFNGDERLDIVTVNQSNDNVSILSQGTALHSRTPVWNFLFS